MCHLHPNLGLERRSKLQRTLDLVIQADLSAVFDSLVCPVQIGVLELQLRPPLEIHSGEGRKVQRHCVDPFGGLVASLVPRGGYCCCCCCCCFSCGTPCNVVIILSTITLHRLCFHHRLGHQVCASGLLGFDSIQCLWLGGQLCAPAQRLAREESTENSAQIATRERKEQGRTG